MSDDHEKPENEGATAAAAESAGEPERAGEVWEGGNDEAPVEKVTERVDADGLPLDREPTIDDVRSQTGLHGRIGLGCVLLIVLLVAGFWLLRAGIIG